MDIISTELNERQKKFCDEYIIDFNATHAAIRAGYKPSNAGSTGCKLLQYPAIDAYIVLLRAEQARQKVKIQEHITDELMVVAFADAGDLIDVKDEFAVLDINNERRSRAIANVQVSKSKTKGGDSQQLLLKMHDKVAALRVLAQCYGMFDKRPKAPDELVMRRPRPEPSLYQLAEYEKNAPQGLPPETEEGTLP